MNTLADQAIRWLALGLLISQNLYWLLSEFHANRAKAKHQQSTLRSVIERYSLLPLVIVMALQLVGVITIMGFVSDIAVETLGLLLAITGFGISISARHTLGDNWTHAAEYQIKDQHQLVDTGVYHFIRHPIYIGLGLAMMGIELIVHSLLWVIIVPFILAISTLQAKREEILLAQQFGAAYKEYSSRTAKFIPGVW